MIAIVILSLPILCLLVSIICCIICIRVARRGGKKIKHEARDYRKERRRANEQFQKQFQKQLEKEKRWFVYECLLYAIALLASFVYGLIYKWNASDQEINVTDITKSITFAVVAVVANLLSSREINFITILQKSDIFKMFFSKKSSVIVFSVLLWGIGVYTLCRLFFSKNVLEWFTSTGNVFQFSFAIVSFLLLGSAALTFTRKMLEYAKAEE